MTFREVVEWWQSKDLKTVEDYTQVLDNFKVVFTCNSNNIENINVPYHTTREIFEDETLTPVEGLRPRDLFEVQNQGFAFSKLIKCLADKRPLSIELILELHRVLLYGSYDSTRWNKGERPGTFKKGDYCVGMTEEGSAPEDVQADLEDIITEVLNTKANPLLLAVYFHVQFEAIHPFADGNGRLGRLLMNYILMSYNYPPCVIHAEDKNTYYLGLEVFDRTGEIAGLIKFVEEQIMKTWKHVFAPRKKYTLEQIKIARELAPDAYKNKSDDELWDLVSSYVQALA